MTLTTAPAPENTTAAPVAAPTRVFVGLRIAPQIATQLAALAADLPSPSVRRVAPADIHLTLVPPWNESSTPAAIEKLTCVAGKFAAFSLTIEHVGYGPQHRRPRLIWADCAPSDDITALRAALMVAFGQTDERSFQPHVTLARMRGDGPAIARKHPIDQPLSLTQRVETVELFQSPPQGERGYRLLASLPLGKAAGAALDR